MIEKMQKKCGQKVVKQENTNAFAAGLSQLQQFKNS
jgi:hypothetical protein